MIIISLRFQINKKKRSEKMVLSSSYFDLQEKGLNITYILSKIKIIYHGELKTLKQKQDA